MSNVGHRFLQTVAECQVISPMLWHSVELFHLSQRYLEFVSVDILMHRLKRVPTNRWMEKQRLSTSRRMTVDRFDRRRSDGGETEQKTKRCWERETERREKTKSQTREGSGRQSLDGDRGGREGVEFAGESVSSPLHIPIKTWPPFRNTLRSVWVCVWGRMNHNVGTEICSRYSDFRFTFI